MVEFLGRVVDQRLVVLVFTFRGWDDLLYDGLDVPPFQHDLLDVGHVQSDKGNWSYSPGVVCHVIIRQTPVLVENASGLADLIYLKLFVFQLEEHVNFSALENVDSVAVLVLLQN